MCTNHEASPNKNGFCCLMTGAFHWRILLNNFLLGRIDDQWPRREHAAQIVMMCASNGRVVDKTFCSRKINDGLCVGGETFFATFPRKRPQHPTSDTATILSNNYNYNHNLPQQLLQQPHPTPTTIKSAIESVTHHPRAAHHRHRRSEQRARAVACRKIG